MWVLNPATKWIIYFLFIIYLFIKKLFIYLFIYLFIRKMFLFYLFISELLIAILVHFPTTLPSMFNTLGR
jgi:hypothetical protein